jgi:outer membrane protein OmpA-like peptidoglycan-associated protein
MARRKEISRIGLKRVIVAGGMFLAGIGSAFAQEPPTEAEILKALTSGHTRHGAGSPEQQRRDAEERRFIDSLRARTARSLTLDERAEVAEIAKARPSIDIEINFDYNSDAVGPKATRPLLALGCALSDNALKGTVFFVNGHTDAKGGTDYNQDLSERRAEAVKRVLIEEFNLPADTLIAVGYGKTQLKNTTDPFAGENRRVRIVNTDQQTAAGDHGVRP